MRKTIESDILYEDADEQYYVIKVKTGYEVYQNGLTHATRVSQIGWNGDVGFQKAIAEINRRKKEKEHGGNSKSIGA